MRDCDTDITNTDNVEMEMVNAQRVCRVGALLVVGVSVDWALAPDVVSDRTEAYNQNSDHQNIVDSRINDEQMESMTSEFRGQVVVVKPIYKVPIKANY